MIQQHHSQDQRNRAGTPRPSSTLTGAGAAWAALEYPDADIRCITFGSPRVANKVFGKAFNALVGTSLRLVHGFDPIPSLPPSLM